MDKEILKQLKINLQKIEEKKEHQEQKKLEITYKNTEKVYYQIWRQILRQMLRKEEFEVMLRSGELVHAIEVNGVEKKVLVCDKINCQKLYNAFTNDGLRCECNGYDLILFIKRSELKEILESLEPRKTLK